MRLSKVFDSVKKLLTYHCATGLEPIKAFWDIDRLLPIQIRRLRNQHVHFEQTLRLLLSQIVNSDEVEELIAAPNSDICRTPEVQESLEQHLQESYNAYQDTVGHIEEIMKKIARDFKMDHSERVRDSNTSTLRDIGLVSWPRKRIYVSDIPQLPGGL
jgi:response regulator RpfG family c-di-GMP phosphodiesterase